MHGRGETPALAREADFIPVTKATLSERARLIVSCRTAGIHRTVRLTDALLAATGVVHGLPVVTQDADLDQIAVARPALQMLRV